MENTKNQAIREYERKQAEIRKLLEQIAVGLEMNDRNRTGEITWASVGYLGHLASELKDVKDSLHGTGEYAK